MASFLDVADSFISLISLTAYIHLCHDGGFTALICYSEAMQWNDVSGSHDLGSLPRCCLSYTAVRLDIRREVGDSLITISYRHSFSVPSGFAFFGGDGSCDGIAQDCPYPLVYYLVILIDASLPCSGPEADCPAVRQQAYETESFGNFECYRCFSLRRTSATSMRIKVVSEEYTDAFDSSATRDERVVTR